MFLMREAFENSFIRAIIIYLYYIYVIEFY